MSFKDAAFEILKKAGRSLHYEEITNQALAAGLLETSGKTPHASMGSLLYTDTLDPNSRFRRGDESGTFALKATAPAGIQEQIELINEKVRRDLRKHLYKMPPQKFEDLVRQLLVQMGFEETETTPYSKDKGVDVRGILRTNPLSTFNVAIQVKCWKNNVGPDIVQQLRGSLKATAEQGFVVTSSDFTSGAKAEALADGKTPITLINGNELVDLLIKHQVGVTQRPYIVPSIDPDFWSEVLGVSFSELDGEPVSSNLEERKLANQKFPLAVQGKHNGQIYAAELLDLQGNIRMNGQEYSTPTTAAKVITTDWKEVNGWDFWRFLDPCTGKWEKVGVLRKSKGAA